MTPRQYADDLVAKPCKVAGVYNEGPLNDVFIKGVDACICHSLRHYWVQNPQKDLTDIALLAKSFLSIRKVAGVDTNSIQVDRNQSKTSNRRSWNSHPITIVIATHTISTQNRSSRHRSKSPSVLHVQKLRRQTPPSNTTPSSPSSMSILNHSFCRVCYDPSHLTQKYPLLARDSFAALAEMQSSNMQKLTGKRNRQTEAITTDTTILVAADEENNHHQIGTLVYRKAKIIMLQPRKTRAEWQEGDCSKKITPINHVQDAKLAPPPVPQNMERSIDGSHVLIPNQIEKRNRFLFLEHLPKTAEKFKDNNQIPFRWRSHWDSQPERIKLLLQPNQYLN